MFFVEVIFYIIIILYLILASRNGAFGLSVHKVKAFRGLVRL
jgi:hypothetical protein